MPSYRSAAHARARARPAPRATRRVSAPRVSVRRVPAIRWDRVGRTVLLIVLTVVVALYVQHTISFLSMRARAEGAQSAVRALVRANHLLEREQRSLSAPATIVARARQLGMVRPGERPYVVIGLPNR